MPLANCPVCSRMFNQTLNEPCAPCREAEEEAYVQVFEYLGRKPMASLGQVSDGTGVDPDRIRRMVRLGRLVGFDSLMMSVLACQRCAVPIPVGRFCATCQRDLRTGFASPR